ncbi:MAG: preprotein translocase subunit Sec61beta [Candidatus Bathyarchaeota archaeon]
MASRVKRRREGAPMPAVAAGLLRFYEEESFGVKIRPELVVVAAVIIAAVVAILPLLIR